MGKELYEADLGFAKAFDRLCEQLDQRLKPPLKEIVFAKGKKAEALLEDTTWRPTRPLCHRGSPL